MTLVLFKYIGLGNETSWTKFEQLTSENVLAPSKPDSFNDPFDVSPVLIDDLSEQEIEVFLKSDRGASFAKNYGTTADKLFENQNEFKRLIVRTMRSLRTDADVLCFSRNISSPLLWAHYANGYKGACLVFAPNEQSILRNALQVEYNSQRPLLPLSILIRRASKPRDSNEFTYYTREFVRLQYGVKSSDWAYEQEYRIAFLPEVKQNWKIGEPDFRGVVFGPLTSDDVKDRVIATLKKHGRTTRVYGAELSETEYSMNVGWT